MGQVAAPKAERRAVERTPTTLRGKVFPGALDCVLSDYTRRGARLLFEGAAPSQPRLVVVVWSSGLAFEVDIRWREGRELGVRFLSSRDLRRPAPPYLAAAQAAWRKRRPRITRRKLASSPVILQKRRRLIRELTPTAE